MASIAFIKRPQPLDANTPLQSQVQLINLPGAVTVGSGAQGVSPFEILHSIIHLALGPYFDAYTKSQENSTQITKFVDGEAKTGIILAVS